MGIRLTVAAVAVMVLTASIAAPAVAHELIPEASGKGGAILHISPGDDPVAGEEAYIYYEVKTGENLNGATAFINVSSSSGSINETMPATLKNSTASVGFIFPVRDAYAITLYLGLKGSTQLQFRTSLLVSRGVRGATARQPVPAWAKAGCVISVWGLFLLALSAFRHRKVIAARSR